MSSVFSDKVNTNKFNSDELKIKVFKSDKDEMPQIKLAEEGILLKNCFSLIVIGRSGSGKTNCVLNLFLNENMYKDYFDYILYVSPTAESDTLVKHLGLPPEQIITEVTADKIQQILDRQKEIIDDKGEGWCCKNHKVCIVYDDCISNQKFCKSKPMLTSFVAARHYGISVVFLSQSYKKIERSCRMQSNGIIYFPASEMENDKFAEEWAPVGLNKREFGNMINYATADRFNFLFINNQVAPHLKYRKNFEELLNIGDYMGNTKDMRKEIYQNMLNNIKDDKDCDDDKSDKGNTKETGETDENDTDEQPKKKGLFVESDDELSDDDGTIHNHYPDHYEYFV